MREHRYRVSKLNCYMNICTMEHRSIGSWLAVIQSSGLVTHDLYVHCNQSNIGEFPILDLPDPILYDIFKSIIISTPLLASSLRFVCRHWDTIYRSVLECNLPLGDPGLSNDTFTTKFKFTFTTYDTKKIVQRGFTPSKICNIDRKYPHVMIWIVGTRYIYSYQPSDNPPARPIVPPTPPYNYYDYTRGFVFNTLYPTYITLVVDMPAEPSKYDGMNRKQIRAAVRGKKVISRGQREEWKGQRRRR